MMDRYLALTGYATKELTVSRQIKCGSCNRQFTVEQTTAIKEDLYCPYCCAKIPYLPEPTASIPAETVAEAARRGFHGAPLSPMDEGDDPR
jgi:DNA-directed RNA polymerase subunit RPC12/RpoP